MPVRIRRHAVTTKHETRNTKRKREQQTKGNGMKTQNYNISAKEIEGAMNALKTLQDTLCTVGKEADAITQQVRVISRTVAKTKPTPGLQALAEPLNPRRGRIIKEDAPAAAPAVT